jgi:hypothetical protein
VFHEYITGKIIFYIAVMWGPHVTGVRSWSPVQWVSDFETGQSHRRAGVAQSV